KPQVPKRAETEPLAEGDLSIGDSTQPLDLNEVELANVSMQMADKAASILRGEKQKDTTFATENATMALDADDIANMAVSGPPKTPLGRPGLPGVPNTKLPPPPPRPPTISARARRNSAPPPMPRKAQAPVRRPPLP